MHQEEITAIFDHQASTYDDKWIKLAPINHALHLLTSTVLAHLPAEARILCVGAGTGAEIFYLAQQYPGWHFTAVEPSAPMLEVLQRKATHAGIATRIQFHQGYLDSLPAGEPFHAATCFLVSQFILDRAARTAFFNNIARRLIAAGLLVTSDLCGHAAPHPDALATTPDLLEVWFRVMSNSGALTSPEEVQKMREAYQNSVAVLPPADVRDLITQGGFSSPVQFYQAGMIHAHYARKQAS